MIKIYIVKIVTFTFRPRILNDLTATKPYPQTLTVALANPSPALTKPQWAQGHRHPERGGMGEENVSKNLKTSAILESIFVTIA